MKNNYQDIPDDRLLNDGVWMLTADIKIHPIDDEGLPTDDTAVLQFQAANPDWVFASPYECYPSWLLSRKPTRVTGWSGQFNHGSSAVVPVEQAGRILILAEND